MNSNISRTVLCFVLLSFSVLVGCGGGGGTPSTPPSTPSSPTQGQITTTTLKEAALGVYYHDDVYAMGLGSSPTWALSSGALPPGMTCCEPGSSATAIKGTPTQVGTYTFYLSASGNAQTVSRSFTLKVVPNDVAITTTSLPSGDTATDYNQTIQAVRGEYNNRTWSIVEGSLPPGIMLSGSYSAYLIGRPTKAGVFPFTVQVRDGKSTARASFSVTIARAALSIQNTGLPKGINGTPYGVNFRLQGGSGDKSWSISNGSLPPGVSFSPSTQSLGGTPSQAGLYSFTVRVDDDTSFVTADYTIEVVEKLKVSTTSLPNGSVGVPYSFQLQSVNGVGPYTWSTSSTLPSGMTLSPDGLLQGTPGLPWKIESLYVRVKESSSLQQTADARVSLTIDGPMVITTKALPPAISGQSYSAAPLKAYGGVTPYTWSISAGSLPSGLALDPATGQLSGTPSGGNGNSSFTVKVSDASATPQSATQDLAILTRSSLGRNDSIPTATFVSSGTWEIQGSISPYESGPDQDYYRLASLSDNNLTFSVVAASMVPVLEILDESGQQLQTCGSDFRKSCLLDYHEGYASPLLFKVPGNGEIVFYVHVLDYFGDARPDFGYHLYVGGY